jgi:hypothetical protein
MKQHPNQTLKPNTFNNHQKVVLDKTKKIIAGVLIFSQLAFWPGVILAQVSVPTSDSRNGNTVGGIAGEVQNIKEQTQLESGFSAYQKCLVLVQKADTAFNSAVPGASTSAVLSPTGNGALLTAMGTLDTAYNVFLDVCAYNTLILFTGTIVPFVPGLPASNVYLSTMKQQYISQMNSGIATYTKKRTDLEAKIDNANQGFWKTLLISMLLKTSKVIADTLVTKLVNNYKIANMKQYADSAATLMYDNQFIRQNFPNNQDQLMARSILENPAFRSQIQPAIFVAADAALGYNPSAMNPASPNFYGQMAAMGSPNANPYYLQTAYVGSLDQSRSASMATAQQQISQGSGYKAPVNCAGSLVQQKQIDTQAIALQKQMADRQALLTNLQQAQTANPGSVKSGDLLKATSDYNAAYNAWNSAPDAITGANGSTSTAPAIIMCEAISSPAVLVNQGIDALFKAMGGNLTQYNGSNLPAYINLITGIATQIGTSMVLGGVHAGATSAIVNENTAVAATASLAGSIPANNSANNLPNNPVIFYNSGTDTQNNTTLSWNVVTTKLTTASYATLSGPGVTSTTHQPLDGSATVSPTTPATYVLTVFDPTGKSLGNSTLAVLPYSQQSLNYNPNAPAVAGAYTQKAAILTRGPIPELNIRGQ